MERLPVRYAVLRHHRAWEMVQWTSLEQEADGALTLVRLPDTLDGRAIVEPGPYNSEISGIAVGPRGDIYLSEPARHSVLWIVGPCQENTFHSGAELDLPRGLTICNGSLYAADSSSARVHVFRLPTLELRSVWTDSLRMPIALGCDGRGRIYVLDQALECVLRFDAAGNSDASYNANTQHTFAGASPAALAVGDDDTLYVTDKNTNRILHFDTDGSALPALPSIGGPAQPRAIAAHANRLYVACAQTGQVCVYHTGYGWIGLLPGYRGPVSALTFDAGGRLFIRPGTDDRYHVLEAARAFTTSGSLTAGPFDAGEESDWERVHARVELPADTRAELRVITKPAQGAAPSETDWAADGTLAASLDTLLQPVPGVSPTPGARRYLWLRVALRSRSTRVTPRVLQIEAETVGETYLDHLPSVYARDDAPRHFLARWLTLFRSEFADWERALAEAPRHLDPDLTPQAELARLAQWLAFELPAGKTEAELRALFAQIPHLYARRGTRAALEDFCELYAGVRPHVFEAFRERHVWQLGHDSSQLGFGTRLPAALPDGMIVPGFTDADPAYFGLTGEYYSGTNFDRLRSTRIDPVVDFDWQLAAPIPGVIEADYFSVRWTGQIMPRYSEVYTFRTASDDGVRLWVNGELLIDDWNAHGVTENSGQIALEAGRWYSIKLEYFDLVWTGSVSLFWSSRSQPPEIIPQERLYALTDPGARLRDTAGDADRSLVVGHTVVGESGPLAAADFGAPLFSDTAHLFTVVVPAASVNDHARRETLKRILETEKPAHTDFHLCLVEPRLRVGFQARVGIDAIVAGLPAPMSMSGAVLGHDSWLGDAPNGDEPAGRVGQRARVGRDAIAS